MDVRHLDLDRVSIADLREEAHAQGIRFLDRLDTDWHEARNRFGGKGECLLGIFDGQRILGVGGLNRDPYLMDLNTGRLRHFYVSQSYRNRGLGRLLLSQVLKDSARHFRRVRLRSATEGAARFYERHGFQCCREPEATHVLWL